MTSANESISVSINVHNIQSVNAQKHLGITTDTNLTWEVRLNVFYWHTFYNGMRHKLYQH